LHASSACANNQGGPSSTLRRFSADGRRASRERHRVDDRSTSETHKRAEALPLPNRVRPEPPSGAVNLPSRRRGFHASCYWGSDDDSAGSRERELVLKTRTVIASDRGEVASGAAKLTVPVVPRCSIGHPSAHLNPVTLRTSTAIQHRWRNRPQG